MKYIHHNQNTIVLECLLKYFEDDQFGRHFQCTQLNHKPNRKYDDYFNKIYIYILCYTIPTYKMIFKRLKSSNKDGLKNKL